MIYRRLLSEVVLRTLNERLARASEGVSGWIEGVEEAERSIGDFREASPGSISLITTLQVGGACGLTRLHN